VAVRKKQNGRLAFTPSASAREYFEGLIRRLRSERSLTVRVTQREAFDHLVALARMGERYWRETPQPLPPPLARPRQIV
jgi:hypothetical protein